jgi:hypothetical protein
MRLLSWEAIVANSCAAFCDSCARGRAIGGLSNGADVGRYIASSRGRFGGVACHLVGGGALLLDCGCDGGGDVVDLVDHAADGTDGLDRALSIGLNSGDFAADVFRGLGDLLGDDGEAPASPARAASMVAYSARRLDCCGSISAKVKKTLLF